jgi:hypothetical protein
MILLFLVATPVGIGAITFKSPELLAGVMAIVMTILPMAMAVLWQKKNMHASLSDNNSKTQLVSPSHISKKCGVLEAECQVCGEVIPARAQRMICEKCGTSHHVECWMYNDGACSTYACKSKNGALIKGGEI